LFIFLNSIEFDSYLILDAILKEGLVSFALGYLVIYDSTTCLLRIHTQSTHAIFYMQSLLFQDPLKDLIPPK